jgi:hypothetical protein
MKYTWHLITKICCWGNEIMAPDEIRRFDGITVRVYTGTKVCTSVATDANYAYSGETKEKL